MTEAEFLKRINQELEWPGELKRGTPLPEERWDSVAVLSVMAFAQDGLNLALSADDLSSVTTVDELLALVSPALSS